MLTEKPCRTRFLSAGRAASMVSQVGLGNCLARLADYLVEDFERWDEFDKTPRVAAHSPDGVIELMPIADRNLYAFKYVNGHPQNHRHALPSVMAFGVLADVDTGMPILLSELTLTTALRTAAMSAVAARVLARRGSRRMALIGNGAQSEFQAAAFHRLLGIREFHLFDIDPAASLKLQRNLDRMGLRGHRFGSVREAVRGCDVVTTATADKTNATILLPEMIEAGMHINAIGGDCPGKTELHGRVLEMGAVFVEYEPQTRIEGELQQMPPDFPVTEIWRVLGGHQPGRGGEGEVTIFDSVGFALEDYSALRFMRDLAIELCVDEEIALVPYLPDPKNLFGLLAGQQPFPVKAADPKMKASGPVACVS